MPLERIFYSKFCFIQLHRLISNFLRKMIDLFLPSATEILDFIASWSTLSLLNDFLQDYDFVMILMGDLSATEKFT